MASTQNLNPLADREGQQNLSQLESQFPTASPIRTSTESTKDEDKETLRLGENAEKSQENVAGMPVHFIPESNLDKGIVGWDSQDDPEMPLNFPQKRKLLLLGLIASITFISPLASSIFASGVSFMDKDFHNTSTILSSFSVSIFVLGYAVGPLFLSPISEIYGRRVVLTSANCFFVAWQIGCALAPNLGALLAFRLLGGIGGSGCLTVGAGVIADLFPIEQRGFANAVFGIGPLFGPVIGPIIGGFIAQRAGWRWIFWVLLITAVVTATGIEIFNTETNPHILIKRKTLRLRAELNRPELRSCYEDNTHPLSPGAVLRNGLLRPLKLLFRSPIVALLSLYLSVVYGLLYLLFTTLPSVFVTTYHWTPDLCGLVFISLGIGFAIGLIATAKLSDATVIRMTTANGGVPEPEMRLPACIVFACFVPITFFWYGWTTDKAVYWLVPVIGLVPFGFGMMGIFLPIQTYLIDAFPAHAASAVAALTASRSLFGAVLPLAAPAMYAKLGLGWGNSLLGFIAVALIPAPAFIYKYGGMIRKKYPIKL
jgi:multidrug resistance protein